VAVGLPPHRLGLGLHAGHGVERDHAAVEHAQAALDLGGEVDVAGRVDQVDLVALPRVGGRRRGDGDALLAFLRLRVHRSRAVVHLARLVDDAGVEQDALGHGRLAGVDADVAQAVKSLLSCHGAILRFLQSGTGGNSGYELSRVVSWVSRDTGRGPRPKGGLARDGWIAPGQRGAVGRGGRPRSLLSAVQAQDAGDKEDRGRSVTLCPRSSRHEEAFRGSGHPVARRWQAAPARATAVAGHGRTLCGSRDIYL